LAILLATLHAAAGAAPIRVTLLTGGHDYERVPYLQIYAANPEIALTHLEHSWAACR
jgi:hypothetical protein